MAAIVVAAASAAATPALAQTSVQDEIDLLKKQMQLQQEQHDKEVKLLQQQIRSQHDEVKLLQIQIRSLQTKQGGNKGAVRTAGPTTGRGLCRG